MKEHSTALTCIELELGIKLHKIEQFGSPVNTELVNALSQDIARYNKQINLFLRSYAEIQAMINEKLNEVKVQAKAQLQYAYDFISMVLEILRFLDVSDKLDEERFKLITEFMHRKAELIETNYYPTAKQELLTFYNPKLRELMEVDLAKRISQRYN
jgi:hypothetical protein